MQPVADELGAAPWLAIPERNAAERQIARHEEGATMEEIFAEQMAAGEPIGCLSRRPPSSSSRSCGRSRSATSSLHTGSMLASLAYGKLAPETLDLPDAQLAIEALRALVPLVPEADRGSIQQVVSNLAARLRGRHLRSRQGNRRAGCLSAVAAPAATPAALVLHNRPRRGSSALTL